MKKLLLTMSVLSALVCCTLAFAISGQSPKSFLSNLGKTKEEVKEAVKGGEDATRLDKNLKLVDNALPLGLSASSNSAVRENANEDDMIIENIWQSVPVIYCPNGANYDSSTNTITFNAGTSSQQIFAGADEEMQYYRWIAKQNAEYTYSAQISATGHADIRACIIYKNNSGLYIWSASDFSLDETNNFAGDFSVNAWGIPVFSPIMVGFIISNADSSTDITVTGNNLTCRYQALEAQPWTSENNLPGLGFGEDVEGQAFIAKCKDGVTTLGLVIDDEGTNVNVAGINTTAEEVSLPSCIIINGKDYMLKSLGRPNADDSTFVMDWSAASSLKKLHMGGAYYLNIDFSDSPLTDLYLGSSFWFDDYLTGTSEIYLHAPYRLFEYRDVLKDFGFKQVLIGEETPDYPQSNNSSWIIAGEKEGDYFGIYYYDGQCGINEIFTDKDSITLPDVTPYDNDVTMYLRCLGYENIFGEGSLCRFAAGLHSVTVPDSYTNLNIYWSSGPIHELHMAAAPIQTYWTLPSNMLVYVADPEYLADFESNYAWNRATLLPDGWDYEWLEINVGRPGDFAQDYIELTDADWYKVMNLKVTGKLNNSDLANMRNLANVRKLDLSEAVFNELPESFMYEKSGLTEIYLPESVLIIPRYAFAYCSSLTKVVAPGSVRINEYGFLSSPSLKEFEMPGVTYIGYEAFDGCKMFDPVIPEGLQFIGEGAFAGTSIKEAVIPEGIAAIPSSAFQGCSMLSKVKLPSTLTEIGSTAFSSCSQLTEINIPEAVASIGYAAFHRCSSLEEISLPENLNYIGSDVFDYCRSLKTVKCKSATPPVADGNFTYDMDMNHTVLYVPSFSIDNYRNADYWNAFYIMKPLNEPLKSIYVNRNTTFDLTTEDNAVLQENPDLTIGYKNENVGQLTVSGDGTLSAGTYLQYHILSRRSYASYSNLRTSLINEADNMRADSVVTCMRCEPNVWHFVTFPYDVKVSDISGWNNTDFAVRRYNGQNRATGDGTVSNWEAMSGDDIMEAGKGYILMCANNTSDGHGYSYYPIVDVPSRNTVTKNRLFTPENVIVPLEDYPAEFAHNRSWNLVGNPYPCFYDMRYVAEGFSSPVILWRGSSYQAYSPVDDEIILRPNESFFVQRPLDAERIVFDKAGRIHYDDASNFSGTPGINAPQRMVADEQRSVFNFNIKGDENDDDRARIVINEKASMAYEQNRDASKFFAETPRGIEIFVNNGISYDICERPFDNGQAVLGVKAAARGTYTISLSGRDIEGWNVVLTDTKTGETADLSSGSYTFFAEPGMEADRFLISFRKPMDVGVDSITDVPAASPVKIVTTSGINVFEGDLNEFRNSAEAGVYIVIDADKSYKIVVK